MRSFKLLSLTTVFALLAAGLSACFVPVPPVAVTYTPTPAPVQDWEAIQQRGTIVVGTSADYPPLSFYDDTFRITGFEPELMRALGERMGVEVQFRDTPFPGLPVALQQRQVDALMAAISITPEREAEMDFTDVYLIGEDAFLVAAGMELGGINTLDEVQRDTRVGVQEGSSYQAWLEQELVEPGLLPAANLLTFADAERAVRDLRAGRIDVVVMDALPAQEFVNQGGVEIAAQGLNRQRYAIAVRTGSDDLRRALNAALDELRRDGTLGQLLTQHLGVEPEEVLPEPTAVTVTPTASPSPTATRVPPTLAPLPPPATRTPTATPIPARCTDGMAWMRDLTFDDKNMTAPPVLSPGQAFVKGWRLRNTGTCTWDNRYRLAFVNGNVTGAQMGGLPVSVAGTVAPGATYDFYVQLVAPVVPGTYQGFWQLYNDLNRPFGARVWVGIRVPSPVTATPTPTPTTPAAQIDFRATPNNIREGDPVFFNWNVQNVREVYFFREGQDWWNHGVEGVGSRTEYPSQTVSYFLRVVKRDGSVETREERIFVEEAANPPDIRFFDVEPDDRIVLGQCVDISWDVRNVNDVDITRNGDSVWRNAPDQGNTRDCPPGVGRFEYRLDAAGPGGNSRARRSVEVIAAATSTPTPTLTPTPVTPTAVPVSISLFNVVPAQIELGQCLSLSWAVIGDPSLIQIKRSGAVILDNAAYSGNMQDCPTQVNTYVYRIEAIQRNGALGDAREVTVVVTGAATATPTNTPTLTPTPTETTAVAPPVIGVFTLSANQIVLGECATLAWSFSGDVSAGNISRTSSLSETVILLTDPAPTGEYPDCPPAADTYTYRLKVGSEFGGTAEQVRTLIVAPPAP